MGSSSQQLATLRVEQPDTPALEVFLQHGITLGRADSNTVCINDPAVELVHARIVRESDGSFVVVCTSESGRIQDLQDQSSVSRLVLLDDRQFRLGIATVTCVNRGMPPRGGLSMRESWAARCPRCHHLLENESRSLKACPGCSLALLWCDAPAKSGSTPFQGWLPLEVGPYRIRALVGRGGMGLVLRGLKKADDRAAAIKLPIASDSGDDSAWIQRFVREIEVLRRLSHPNLVLLQDAGQDQHLAWLAMDWIDGQPLSRLIDSARQKRSRLTIQAIADILKQIVAGLGHLHLLGLVHRDLKPSNILFGRDHSVKLVDFGLSRIVPNESGTATQEALTMTGTTSGTVGYMAPEQFRGGPPTPAVDVYALGVVWYELLTLRVPMGRYQPPAELRPDVPPHWNELIGRCLDFSPVARPDLSDIVSAVQAPPLRSRPPSTSGNRASVVSVSTLPNAARKGPANREATSIEGAAGVRAKAPSTIGLRADHAAAQPIAVAPMSSRLESKNVHMYPDYRDVPVLRREPTIVISTIVTCCSCFFPPGLLCAPVVMYVLLTGTVYSKANAGSVDAWSPVRRMATLLIVTVPTVLFIILIIFNLKKLTNK